MYTKQSIEVLVLDGIRLHEHELLRLVYGLCGRLVGTMCRMMKCVGADFDFFAWR